MATWLGQVGRGRTVRPGQDTSAVWVAKKSRNEWRPPTKFARRSGAPPPPPEALPLEALLCQSGAPPPPPEALAEALHERPCSAGMCKRRCTDDDAHGYTFGFALPGCLAEHERTPYESWPMHCKGVYKRLLNSRQFPKGCAAIAMQARAADVAPGGRGAWTTVLAEANGMTKSCCRDRTILTAAMGVISCTDPDTEREGSEWTLLRQGHEADVGHLCVVSNTGGEEVPLQALCDDAWQEATRFDGEPPAGLPAEIHSLDFCLENPANALWLWLLSLHPRFACWSIDTTSYCKQPRCATPYRKTTCFMSTQGSSAPLPAPCCPTDPCNMVRENGIHDEAIGARETERNPQGYLNRSHIPTPICGRPVLATSRLSLPPPLLHSLSASVSAYTSLPSPALSYIKGCAEKRFAEGARRLLVPAPRHPAPSRRPRHTHAGLTPRRCWISAAAGSLQSRG